MLLQLRQFLSIAEKVVDRRSDNPILSSVCLHNGFIRVTDLEITAKMPVDDDRSFMIPLDILKKVLKTNPKHLEIQISKGPILKIKFDDKAIKFPVAESREYPDEPTEVFQEIGTWPAEIFQQIHRRPTRPVPVISQNVCSGQDTHIHGKIPDIQECHASHKPG